MFCFEREDWYWGSRCEKELGGQIEIGKKGASQIFPREFFPFLESKTMEGLFSLFLRFHIIFQWRLQGNEKALQLSQYFDKVPLSNQYKRLLEKKIIILTSVFKTEKYRYTFSYNLNFITVFKVYNKKILAIT